MHKKFMYRSRQIKRFLAKISAKQWILIGLFLFGLSMLLLRNNSQKIVELRSEVVELDNQGEDPTEKLNELGNFVTSHMNTDMSGPVQLVNRYNKAVRKSQEDAFTNNSLDLSILDTATKTCEQKGETEALLSQCTQAEISKNPQVAIALSDIKIPPIELYSFEFAPPTFSFDLAGILLVFSVGILTTVIALITSVKFVDIILKSR